MLDYLLVLLSVALLAGAFIIQKFYQKNTDGSTESSTVFTMVSACCSIIFLITTNGFKFEFTWYSLINSILKAGCGFLSNSSVKKLDKKLLVMCVSVFILNGFVSVFSKEHQTYTNFPIVSTSAYALIGTVCSLVMSSSLKIAIAIKDKKETYFNINYDAAKFFYKKLSDDDGKVAVAYFKERELTGQCAKYFCLGYSPQKGNELLNHLKEKGYDVKFSDFLGKQK